MKILFIINTCNRPGMLAGLISQIAEYRKQYKIEILIFEDNTGADYRYCRNKLSRYFPESHTWYATENHLGKTNYWQIIDNAFRIAGTVQFDYMIHLPDDVRLQADFIRRSVNAFVSIRHTKKICLNLLREINRSNPGWTQSAIKKYRDYTDTGWVDMCYIADRRFLLALKFQIYPVSPNWAGNPTKSSGVGMQISRRLVEKYYHLFQVNESLVEHGCHESIMHPKMRKKNPLITNTMQVTATLASMPSREKSLKKVIESLLPQVSALRVYLNNYTSVPSYLRDPKILVYKSQDELGDLGDAGKFYEAQSIKGYHFTCDDDLIYPPDYIMKMIGYIEKYNRQYAITLHGRLFEKIPVASYYHGATKSYRCFGDQQKDAFVHVGGTGVMAYHTDTLKIGIDWFKAANMADIWFSKACLEKGVKIVSAAHPSGWIIESRYDRNYSIYEFCNRSDKYQTEVVNSLNWPKLSVLSPARAVG